MIGWRCPPIPFSVTPPHSLNKDFFSRYLVYSHFYLFTNKERGFQVIRRQCRWFLRWNSLLNVGLVVLAGLRFISVHPWQRTDTTYISLIQQVLIPKQKSRWIFIFFHNNHMTPPKLHIQLQQHMTYMLSDLPVLKWRKDHWWLLLSTYLSNLKTSSGVQKCPNERASLFEWPQKVAFQVNRNFNSVYADVLFNG